MTKRYFSATDGKTTVFRGTGRPDGFKFASFDADLRNISFHNSPKPGCYPAVEITAAEYKALTAIKLARLKAASWGYYTSPSDCWVSNSELAGEAA